jgi:hypothetical protein
MPLLISTNLWSEDIEIQAIFTELSPARVQASNVFSILDTNIRQLCGVEDIVPWLRRLRRLINQKQRAMSSIRQSALYRENAFRQLSIILKAWFQTRSTFLIILLLFSGRDKHF